MMGHVMADGAARRRTEKRVVAREVARHAADDRALHAARFGDAGRTDSQGKGHHDRNNAFHRCLQVWLRHVRSSCEVGAAKG
jgi:hypothetical protein